MFFHFKNTILCQKFSLKTCYVEHLATPTEQIKFKRLITLFIMINQAEQKKVKDILLIPGFA